MLPLRIIAVYYTQERRQLMADLPLCAACEVVAVAAATDDLLSLIRRHQPDVIIIDIDAPNRDTLENLRYVQSTLPRPMVMFSEADDADIIRRTVEAGVSAYVVDGIQPKRVRPILDAAIARFEQFHRLSEELVKAKGQLAERKIIDRAKGILMQQRKLSESEAYHLLRKVAMDRNQKLVEVAEFLISAADMLGTPRG